MFDAHKAECERCAVLEALRKQRDGSRAWEQLHEVRVLRVRDGLVWAGDRNEIGAYSPERAFSSSTGYHKNTPGLRLANKTS